MYFSVRHRLLLILCLLGLIASQLSAGEIYSRIKERTYDLFRQKLNVSAEELKITFTYLPENLDVYTNYNINVYSQKSRPIPGQQAVWVDITDRRKLLEKIPVSVDVNVVKYIVVACRRINRGSPIRESDLRMEKRLLGKYWQDYFFSVHELDGCEAKQLIKNGLPLTKRMIRQTPLVQRGQQIKVEIHSKTLTVSFAAVAMDDGFEGDQIKLKTDDTGTIVTGIIASANLAVVYQE